MASPYGIPNKSTGNDNSETFDFGGHINQVYYLHL